MVSALTWNLARRWESLDGLAQVCTIFTQVNLCSHLDAGKSSLIQALFRFVLDIFKSEILIKRVVRIVELQSGKIEIDGTDVSKIGLSVLRGRLALVPQDSVLFLGSLRENL